MKYRVVIEHDTETRHYSATVPGLPGLFLDAKSEREVIKLAKEGVRFYLQELAAQGARGGRRAKPLSAKVVTVDV
ncbi:MAG TPA: type II toxin-antitoxin system HicB family antitoxin [Thermoplasmata archaeon]